MYIVTPKQLIVLIIVVTAVWDWRCAMGYNVTVNYIPLNGLPGECVARPPSTWFPTCQYLMGDYVFIPAGFTVESFATSYQSSISDLASVLQPPCLPIAEYFLCKQTIRTCFQVNLSSSTMSNNDTISLLVPQSACLDQCEAVVTMCQNTLLAGPIAAAYGNCTETFPSNPFLHFPTLGTVHYNTTNTTTTTETFYSDLVPCFGPQNITTTQCTPFFEKDKEDAPCKLICLFPIFSWTPNPSQWRKEAVFDTLGIALAAISFVASVVSVLSHTLINTKTKGYPPRFITCLAVCCLFLSVGQILSASPNDKLRCADAVTPYTASSSPACGAQGVLLQFFFVATFYFWLVLTVVLHLMIVRGWKHQRIQSNHLVIFYHAVGWGVPAILTIASLSAGVVQYNMSLRTCFITDTSSSNGVSWGLLDGWVLLCLALGTPVTLHTLYHIRRELLSFGKIISQPIESVSSSRNSGTTTGVVKFRRAKTPYRMVILAGYFNLYLIAFFVYQSLTLRMNAQVEFYVREYLSCAAEFFSHFSNQFDAPNCHSNSLLATPAYFGFALFYKILSCGQGTLFFLCVTNTAGTRAHWTRSFRSCGFGTIAHPQRSQSPRVSDTTTTDKSGMTMATLSLPSPSATSSSTEHEIGI